MKTNQTILKIVDSNLLLTLFAICFLFLNSCKVPDPEPIIKNYLFLGHIYGTETKINKQFDNFDFKKYDQLWLGGDLLTETTKYSKNLDYLDSIFDLSNQNTKWALGNHDVRNGNLDWIRYKTHRPSFYTDNKDGITYLVLNTNGLIEGKLDPIFVNAQYELISNVCDTISKSSHLVILSHHVPWNLVDSMMIMDDYANINCGWFIFRANPKGGYYWSIYKRFLLEVQSKGVQVIHIGGDFGQLRTKFEYKSTDGVVFLGSGVLPEDEYNKRFANYNQSDSILIFEHDVTNRKLTWEFQELK